MRKITLIITAIFLFLAIFSCEYQDNFNETSTADSKVVIDESSQIKLSSTSLSKEQIEKICCGKKFTATLYAGQHINVGTLTVSNNDTNLYVTYEVTGNWMLEETHLYVGKEEDIPYTNAGNPKIGHFPYHGDHGLTKKYTFKIALKNLDDCFVIIAHASAVKEQNGEITSSETAFAKYEDKNENHEFDGNRWGWYFDYCKKVCDDNKDDDGSDDDGSDDDGSDDDGSDDDGSNDDGSNDDGSNDDGSNDDGSNDDGNDGSDGTNGDTGTGTGGGTNDDNGNTGNDTVLECLDAFAYKEQAICFNEDGFTQWGWTNDFMYSETINYQTNYSYRMPLYAEAVNCNLIDGKIIGYVLIDNVVGQEVVLEADVTYVITDENYELSEIHLYVGENQYPIDANGAETVLPSEYYTFSEYNVDSKSFKFSGVIWPLDTYIIPYAYVCPVGQ